MLCRLHQTYSHHSDQNFNLMEDHFTLRSPPQNAFIHRYAIRRTIWPAHCDFNCLIVRGKWSLLLLRLPRWQFCCVKRYHSTNSIVRWMTSRSSRSSSRSHSCLRFSINTKINHGKVRSFKPLVINWVILGKKTARSNQNAARPSWIFRLTSFPKLDLSKRNTSSRYMYNVHAYVFVDNFGWSTPNNYRYERIMDIWRDFCLFHDHFKPSAVGSSHKRSLSIVPQSSSKLCRYQYFIGNSKVSDHCSVSFMIYNKKWQLWFSLLVDR